MKKVFILKFFCLISIVVAAHPGIGIVKDSKGNIYYTDLKQVWKIALDGSKTPVKIVMSKCGCMAEALMGLPPANSALVIFLALT